MKWIIQYKDHDFSYLLDLIPLRSVPFYAVQGKRKKGGRSPW